MPETPSNRVLVVGNGIVGQSVAREMLNNSVGVVSIGQENRRNNSASYAAGAMLGAFGEVSALDGDHDNGMLATRIFAARLYEEWVANLRSETATTVELRRGTFVIANPLGGPREARNLDAIAIEAASNGEQSEWVDPSAVFGLKAARHREPHRCLFLPNEGFIDAMALLDALTAALKNSNRFEALDDVATNLLQDGDKIVGVATSRHGEVRADHVVICAGVGTQKLLDGIPAISGSLPRLVAGKGLGILVRTDRDFPYVIRTPNRDFACGTHLVPRSPGVTYIGATNRIWSELPSDDGVMLGEVHFLLESAIHEINLDLRLARVEAMLYGSRPVTVDRNPLVGRTEIEGLSLATGTYRNGILLAPVIAKIVAQEILGTEPAFENPFSPKGRRVDTSREAMKTMLNEAIRDFVSFLQEPGGRLPYNRTQELEDFLDVLMGLALTDGDEYAIFRSEAEEVLTRYPLPEILPELFYRWHYLSRRPS